MMIGFQDAVIDELVQDCGWMRPAADEVDRAIRIVRAITHDTGQSSEVLRIFHDPTGNYAGRTFLDLEPKHPNEIGPADLLAITLLSVSAGPHAIRTIFDAHDEVGRLLAAVPLADLTDADTQTMHAAGILYGRVKSLLGRNPWVVASKLCARKRPALIPVRDNDVVSLLGLANKAHTSDWTVYRQLMRDEIISSHLTVAAREAGLADVPRLRLLDTLLWMETRRLAGKPL